MFTLGVPGEITENLKKLKHAMTESKYKSKGVPTLEITDELSKAVLDMGFITPILKSLMVPVIWLALIGAIYSQIAPFFALWGGYTKNKTTNQTSRLV